MITRSRALSILMNGSVPYKEKKATSLEHDALNSDDKLPPQAPYQSFPPRQRSRHTWVLRDVAFGPVGLCNFIGLFHPVLSKFVEIVMYENFMII